MNCRIVGNVELRRASAVKVVEGVQPRYSVDRLPTIGQTLGGLRLPVVDVALVGYDRL